MASETATLNEDTVRSRFSTDTDRNEVMFLLHSTNCATHEADIVRVAQIYRETHLLRLKKLEIFILTKESIQYFEVTRKSSRLGGHASSPLTPNSSASNLYDELSEDQLKHIDLKDARVQHFTEIPLTDVLDIQADQRNAKLIHHILHFPFTITFLNKKNHKQNEVIYCPSWDECQRWVEVITKTKADFEKRIEERTNAMLAATE